jgi:uncharacterized membrane protein YoaK (UPF0700 family)
MDKFATREFYTVVIGGSALAHIAGFVNAVSLSGAYAQTVAHITGHVTRMGMYPLEGKWKLFGILGGIIFSFMSGSFVSGYMLDSSKFQLGGRYGIALVLESIALFFSWILLRWDLVVGELAAAFAMGIQNAMASNYSGAVLRTTHMTGICTDIGIVIGQWVSKNPRAETWKLKVLLPLFIGFWSGGITGSLAYSGLKENSLLLPSIALMLIAIFFLTWEPAREAREVLAVAVKRVTNELESGMRTIATPLVPLVDLAKAQGNAFKENMTVTVARSAQFVRHPGTFLTSVGIQAGGPLGGDLRVPTSPSAGFDAAQPHSPGHHLSESPATSFHIKAAQTAAIDNEINELFKAMEVGDIFYFPDYVQRREISFY